jgi:oligopeptide/dipeptide ABC transporter ATP-binding protein
MDLLGVRNLKVYFYPGNEISKVVDDVSLDVSGGQTVALVGESGCGKTVFSLALLNLVPSPGKIVGGLVNFQGKNLLESTGNELQNIRGKEIAMVFQEPLSSFNPLFTVGFQICESLVGHLALNKEEARTKAIEILDKMELPQAELRFSDYPHQLSGGMRQRAMIAMGLACKPKLLILDEPTTALDVTIQAQIIDLIKEIKEEEEMSIILITHDLAIVEDLADKVAIMYAGKIVEIARTQEIFRACVHPYTLGLLRLVMDLEQPKKTLKSIPGAVPDLRHKPSGCPFHPRCERRIEPCNKEFPQETKINETHSVWCYNPF